MIWLKIVVCLVVGQCRGRMEEDYFVDDLIEAPSDMVHRTNEQQIPPQKLSQDIECKIEKSCLIKSYFVRTRIIRSDDTDVHYCGKSSHRTYPEALFDPLIDLSLVIDFYRSLDNVKSYTNMDPNNPITQNGFLSINDKQHIPLYTIADIRRRHLPSPNSYPRFGQDITDQMELMGQLETDDIGYLLAHSLGGSSTPLNFIPMARNVNRYLSLVPCNASLGIPRSYWKSNEDWIRRYLLTDYPNGRIEWRVAVKYADDVTTHPKSFSHYRPVSFTLQFTAYTNQDDDNSVYYTSPHITYFNDNDFSCGFEETCPPKRFDVNLQLKCDIHFPKQPSGTFGLQPSQGRRSTGHQVAFTYTIEGKTYFYAQTIKNGSHWFIQELLPNGKMGEEKSHGSWNENYPVMFTYFINGRQYFYGHNTYKKTWFIQELLPDGQMGPETSHGLWSMRYQEAFPFTISGKHYFYSQSIIDGNHWFIQELLPDGKMGKEKSSGSWMEQYPVAFPFMINGSLYFYGHSRKRKNWFIQELLPDGTMGKETSQGAWGSGYQVSVPYYINGKHYFFGQSFGRHWFIQELLPNGRMGKETSKGDWTDSYPVVFPYTIEGRHYLYGYSTNTMTWFIKELL